MHMIQQAVKLIHRLANAMVVVAEAAILLIDLHEGRGHRVKQFQISQFRLGVAELAVGIEQCRDAPGSVGVGLGQNVGGP